MNSLDARARYTKMMIEDSFLSLLQEKPAAKITVTELCQRAQINRATFYKHYQDIPDLLSSKTDEIILQIRQFMTEHSSQEFEKTTLQLLQFLQNNGTRVFTLVSQNADPELPTRIFDVCYQVAYPMLAKNIPAQNAAHVEFLYHYLCQGCGGVLAHWLRNGMIQPPEEIAQFIVHISIQTVHGFVSNSNLS